MTNEIGTKPVDIPILYVFVRTDMNSMTPGKAQAHSGHAANAFIYKNHIKTGKPIEKAILEWVSATPFGFGTQINLKAPWEDVVRVVDSVNQDKAGAAEVIIDPTYPYLVNDELLRLIDPAIHTIPPVDIGNGMFACHRKEETAAYVFGRKGDLSQYVGQYPLHP